jgi:hypothetical protein
LVGIKCNAPANSRLLRIPGTISSVHQVFVSQQGALHFWRLGILIGANLLADGNSPHASQMAKRLRQNIVCIKKINPNIKIIQLSIDKIDFV